MKEIDVVCGVIIKDKKVLIAQRKSVERDGIWEFAGGKVEKNECREDAVVRELYEELGLQTQVVKHLCTIYDQREQVRIRVDAYHMQYMSGNIHLVAHYQAKWVSMDELNMYMFERADSPIIELVKEQLRSDIL